MQGSKKGACSANTQKAKGNALQHARREGKVPSYVNTSLTKNNTIIFEDDSIKQTKYLNTLKSRAEKEYKEKTGQKCQKSFAPLRETVCRVNPGVTDPQILKAAQEMSKTTGWKVLGIYHHKDEGHVHSKYIEGDENFEINDHVHIIWDCQDHKTGKAIRCDRKKLSRMQDDLAGATGMERGNKASETGLKHRNAVQERTQMEETRIALLEQKKTELDEKTGLGAEIGAVLGFGDKAKRQRAEKECEKAIKTKNEALKDRDEANQARKEAVQRQKDAEKKLAEAIQTNENLIKAKTEVFMERNKAVQMAKEAIQKREKAIQECNKAIQAKTNAETALRNAEKGFLQRYETAFNKTSPGHQKQKTIEDYANQAGDYANDASHFYTLCRFPIIRRLQELFEAISKILQNNFKESNINSIRKYFKSVIDDVWPFIPQWASDPTTEEEWLVKTAAEWTRTPLRQDSENYNEAKALLLEVHNAEAPKSQSLSSSILAELKTERDEEQDEDQEISQGRGFRR